MIFTVFPFPAFLVVTTPLEFTVAYFLLLLLYVSFLFTFFPGVTVAFIVTFFPAVTFVFDAFLQRNLPSDGDQHQPECEIAAGEPAAFHAAAALRKPESCH